MEYDEIKFSPVVNTVDENEQFEQFYYSKFQLQIDKKYELRIFFIAEKFYATAIFPKDKINSKVVENEAHYPRIIPFKLPKDIEEKLKRFNQKMDLNTGSFDIIVDEKDEYYFLEVNPVGQFDYVSKLCNYNLDLEIAKHFKSVLINDEK